MKVNGNRHTGESYSSERRKRLGLVRWQLELPQDAMDELDAVKDYMGSASRIEVVRRAIYLISEVVIRQKGKLILRREDGTEAEVLVL